MRHPRTTTKTTARAAIGIAVAVLAVGATAGGLIAAGGASASYPTRIDPSQRNSVSGPAISPAAAATVDTASETVDGKSEVILVDAQGDPLYTFKADTPTSSRVTGQLAIIWPPLTASGTPTIAGANGKLTSVPTRSGEQVAYNGHFLYSFVSDGSGHVTGQGVQDFFVATPATGASSSAGGSYGY